MLLRGSRSRRYGAVLPLLLLSSAMQVQNLLQTTTASHRSVSELMVDGFRCYVVSDCQPCSQDELTTPFCQRTRRRQEYTCEKHGTVVMGEDNDGVAIERKDAEHKRIVLSAYEACSTTAGDDLTAVIRFQALMAIVGGLALYGVRHQKYKHQTLYDRRSRDGRRVHSNLGL